MKGLEMEYIISSVWKQKLEDYVLSPRLCIKHFRAMLKKKKIKGGTHTIVPGVCEKCSKIGITYYLNTPNDKKN